MKRIQFHLPIVLGLLAAAVPAMAATTSSFTATEEAAIARLKAQIGETIGKQPNPSAADQYEAQIMLTIEQSEEPCPIVVAALDRALGEPVPAEATKAMKVLVPIVQKCGTSALNEGLTYGPSYSIGGGTSDYRP